MAGPWNMTETRKSGIDFGDVVSQAFYGLAEAHRSNAPDAFCTVVVFDEHSHLSISFVGPPRILTVLLTDLC
jgi:hypothetical protein